MATTKTAPAPGPAIVKGLAALAILALAWYFVGKGDRAFREAATALRPVLSYEVRLRDADTKVDTVISVSCPSRFALVAQTSSGPLNRVVVGDQAYAQVENSRWLKIPASMSGLPALSLCPQLASTSNDPKDLPSLLEFLARKARLESTSQTTADGKACRGFRAVPRGPNPEPKPLLTICLAEPSHLPVEVVLGTTIWTFSKWGEPFSISAPAIDTAPLEAPSPTPTPSP